MERQRREDSVWNLMLSTLSRAGRTSTRSGELKRLGTRSQRCGFLKRGEHLKTMVVELRDPSPSWFSCLHLALWDNIFGPRLQHVWNSPASRLTEEEQLSTARHTLSGELSETEEQPTSDVQTKFHVFTEMGCAMAVVLFNGELQGSVHKFALCLIVPISKLARFLLVYRTVDHYLLYLVASLRTLMDWGKDVAPQALFHNFTTLLPKFVNYTEPLFHSGLHHVDPQLTFLGQKTYHHAELPFLYRAITSHLITQHRSIVMGSNLESVNAWVDALSLFLPSDKIELCSRARENSTFIPNLLLQGLPHQELYDEKVIWSLGPLTVIDLDQSSVHQSIPLHRYTQLRQQYFAALQADPLTSNQYHLLHSFLGAEYVSSMLS